MEGTFADAITDVVNSGNCSGCGACTLMSPRVSMSVSAAGFLRPMVAPSDEDLEERSLRLFDEACPGRKVVAPLPESKTARVHPTFGRVERVWEAWASDDEIRHTGSSGGVITALTTFFLEQQPGATAAGVAGSPSAPLLTIPLRIANREEALQAAGSRYAPASTLAGLTGGTMPDVAAMKPCEASALRQLSKTTGQTAPLIFSFFCAGTPSQKATQEALERFDIPNETIEELHYRGRGWPGSFTASDGLRTESASGIGTWIEYFNGALQSRCKICVDATGEAADVAVGDYWLSDGAGNPVYDEAMGRSVVIARSARGLAFVERAIRDGVIVAHSLDLDLVSPLQEHQQARRQMLMARMLGRRAAGGQVPSYRGYRLGRRLFGAPASALRAFFGSLRRGAGREKPTNE